MFSEDRLSDVLSRLDCAAIVSCTRENVFYFSGFDPVIKTLSPYTGVCWSVITRESLNTVHIVHSHGEADQLLDATAQLGHTELYGTFYREGGEDPTLGEEEFRLRAIQASSAVGRSPGDAIVALFSALGLTGSRVAIDLDGVHRGLEAELRNRLPHVTIVDGSGAIRGLRALKAPREVEALKLAARSLEGAIACAAATINLGVSERDLANSLEQSLIASGARPALTMLKIGKEAVFGQRRQREDVVVGHGDVAWFDCDASRQMYWADIARVYSVGAVNQRRQIFDALLTGQLEGLAHIRPGMTGEQAFDLVMSAVHKAGFPQYRRHHVGHGIGLEPYERPILAPGNQDVIQAGMVLSVETPFYEYGWGALHIEDPVLIGTEGNTVLTMQPGSLLVL